MKQKAIVLVSGKKEITTRVKNTNMTNKNIDLPSQRAKIVMDIEKPLRRQFRSEKKEIPTWVIVLLFLAVATLGYFVVARVVNDQVHAAEVSREYTYSTLCERYKSDSALTGTAAEETLSTICK